jgi:lipoprotein-anchoring transpeptidase ErfK/SrfK
MINRRTFLSSLVAAPLLSNYASAAEPFPVKMNEWKKLDYKYQRREMEFATTEPTGTIVVDPRKCFLYVVGENGMALRYGVSVGKSAKAWTGEVVIKKLAEWPVWRPSPYHLEQIPSLIKWKDGMPGGLENPMGARALYLYKGEVDTVNRIHGSMKLADIGKKATAGCIGMLNCDVIDLYTRVQLGTRVVMLG